MAELEVPAGWLRDCQGKWDYDGRLVSLSARYWPARYQQNNKPSAKATIYLGSTQDAYCDDAVPLIAQEFEALTEAEVKRMVEVWVAEQYQRIHEALRVAFGVQEPLADLILRLHREGHSEDQIAAELMALGRASEADAAGISIDAVIADGVQEDQRG